MRDNQFTYLDVAIILVFKDEGDKLGEEECRVRMCDNMVAVIAEDDPSEVHDFGAASRGGQLGKFAGIHCKEPSIK